MVLVFQVGEDFSPEACISCSCEVDKTFGNPEYGGAVCEVMTCPVLPCDGDHQVLNTTVLLLEGTLWGIPH